MSVKEDLISGRANVEKNWASFAITTEKESCCAWSALPGVLNPVYGFVVLYEKNRGAEEALIMAIKGSFAGESNQLIWAWNDETGRTKEEVLAVYDKAIASCTD